MFVSVSALTAAGASPDFVENALKFDNQDNLYYVCPQSNTVYKITPAGAISLIAGNGNSGYSGDGGPATSAELNFPFGISIDTAGNIYIFDTGNQRVRKVDVTGIITTIAGNGVSGFTGDGSPATDFGLNMISNNPFQLTGSFIDPKTGALYFSDSRNNLVRMMTAP